MEFRTRIHQKHHPTQPVTEFFRITVFLSVAFFCTPISSALEQEPVEAAIIGRFANGPVGVPIRTEAGTFGPVFGSSAIVDWPAEIQANRFFAQGGIRLWVIRADPGGNLSQALVGAAGQSSGLHALPLIRDLGILICPELTTLGSAEFSSVIPQFKNALLSRRATLILDPPAGWTTTTQATNWVSTNIPAGSPNLTLYFPYLNVTLSGSLRTIGASGTMAAAWLQNDAGSSRGIWRAPAGTHLPLVANSLSKALTSNEQSILNNAGIGMLITASGNVIPWSARHLDGGTSGNAENRFISVQRTLDWISTNITRKGNSLATHRENDAALWSSLRSETEAILSQMWSRGAFVGTTPEQGFFVQCGLGSTMTQADVQAKRVKLLVGVSLLRPSEFIVKNYEWSTRDPARPEPEPVVRILPGTDAWQRQLFYFGNPGSAHVLRSSFNLHTDWQNLSNPANGDGTWLNRTINLTGPRRFYRIEQKPLLPP